MKRRHIHYITHTHTHTRTDQMVQGFDYTECLFSLINVWEKHQLMEISRLSKWTKPALVHWTAEIIKKISSRVDHARALFASFTAIISLATIHSSLSLSSQDDDGRVQQMRNGMRSLPLGQPMPSLDYETYWESDFYQAKTNSILLCLPRLRSFHFVSWNINFSNLSKMNRFAVRSSDCLRMFPLIIFRCSSFP